MSWQVGLFRGSDKATSDSPEANGDYSLTSRLAGVAVKNDNTLLHLGVSHSFRKPQEDKTYGFSVRPEVHISDKYIKTSVADVENINLFNFETALVANSFSLSRHSFSPSLSKKSVHLDNIFSDIWTIIQAISLLSSFNFQYKSFSVNCIIVLSATSL